MPSPSYSSRRRREWLGDDGLTNRDIDQDENESMEEHSVVWQDDQRLKREMMQVAEYASIPLPAPTQRAPRPAELDSPASASASSSHSSRKRPRRTMRSSMPLYEMQMGTIGSSSTAGPSSAPLVYGLLDDLLDQAERLYVQPPAKSSRTARYSGGAPPSSNAAQSSRMGATRGFALGEKSVNSPRKAMTMAPPTKGSASAAGSEDMKRGDPYKTPSLPHTSSDESMTSSSTATDDTAVPITPTRSTTNAHTRVTRSTPSAAALRIGPALLNHVPASNLTTGQGARMSSGAPPRIGIRSGTTPAASSNASGTPLRRVNKPFKMPTVQPTRSSSRQAAKIQPQVSSTTPSKGSTSSAQPRKVGGSDPAAAERRLAAVRASCGNPAPAAAAVSTAKSSTVSAIRPVPPHRASSQDVADTKMPSSDGVGNESFDSYDGMFADGGDEVDALFAAVDGGL